MSAPLITPARFQFDDGGRRRAGYRGSAGDCGVRAWAIATGRPYQEVYARLWEFSRLLNSRRHQHRRRRTTSPRLGVPVRAMHLYAAEVGWGWTAMMRIGGGCHTHLRAEELPAGRLVARVSRHYVAVVEGVLRDTHDASRHGTRCVYGYWQPAPPLGLVP